MQLGARRLGARHRLGQGLAQVLLEGAWLGVRVGVGVRVRVRVRGRGRGRGRG